MSLTVPRFLFVSAAAALAACGTGHQGGSPTGAGSGGATTGTTTTTGTSAGGGSTSTTSTSSTGSAGTGGSAAVACKRGIAYGYNSVADLTALSKGIGWWYNWSPQPDTGVASAYGGIGVEFVPMAWGQASLSTLAAKVPAGAKYLLGFNEPNFGSQSNLTPTQAAALWPQLEAVAKQKGMKLVSPAVNYCGSPCNVANPFDWLDQFFAACPGCQVDYIAMHWYACTASALTSYLSTFEMKYTQPLWLTEFSCLDGNATTEPDQETYMKVALPILEADPRVFRYAWFTGRSTQSPAVALLGADGMLTPLGQIYVSSPEACRP